MASAGCSGVASKHSLLPCHKIVCLLSLLCVPLKAAYSINGKITTNFGDLEVASAIVQLAFLWLIVKPRKFRPRIRLIQGAH